MTRDSTNHISIFNTALDNHSYYFDNKSPYDTISSTTTPSPQTIDTNREFLLFPTYAKRNPSDSTQWIVRAKGWALSHNSSTAKQKMMMGITKSVAGKSSADQNSSQMFEERFKYFLATNKRRKRFLIQVIGTTTIEEIKRMSTINLFQHQPLFQMLLPITPPTEEEEDDSEEEEEAEAEWDYKDVLNTRPSNPISSVLDGNYFDNNCYSPRKRSSLSMIDSLSTVTTTTTTTSTVLDEGGVHLKTKGSGFLSGQFLIPHDNILNWAQEQNQCDARLIKLQSICTNNNKFLPNENVVNLIEPIGISIISDIDDTIKDTQIKAGARTVLSKTFFEDPKSVTGMADAYMAWYSQGASFHYVSNSPYQLMPMLDKFIRDAQFPPGSMHLRDDGKLISRLVETPGQAKRDAILDILRDFPSRHFILIGDSGEIDLEIYTRIALEFPDQILRIYIRDVTTPTLTEIKHHCTSSISTTKKERRKKNTLSSLFYPKKRSQSSSDFTALEKEEEESIKKFQSPLGVRKAVTTMLAEYAVEPHLTGHRANTIQIDNDNKTLLDPHKKKISTKEACEQLYKRVKKARQQTDIDIILFQEASTLQNDIDIRDALWDMWDSEIDSLKDNDSDNILSSSPTTY